MTPSPNIRLKLPAVRRAVESTQWAIQPDKLRAMLEVLETHAAGGAFTAEQIQARVGDRKSGGRSTGGAVAVLPLYGVISQRMNMMSAMSGGTSTEAFADDFDAAMSNPDVSAIVIDCDSPGGNVQGTPELAKRIFDARGKGKQIIAVANGTMASAAYWICSAADEVVATPSGDVGSIGVFCAHADESEMNAKEGIKYTLISAGDYKTEGNPYQPLTEEALAFTQGQINEMYGMFVGAVAKHRGVKVSAVKADYGGGRCFTASQALAAGMIDRVATIEQTIKKLGAGGVSASGRPRAATDALPMRAEANDLTDEPTEVTEPAAPHLVLVDSDNISTPAGADAASEPTSPDQQPLAAKEHTMDETNAAAVAAERTRAAGIRALGRKHKATDEQIDTMINEGLTTDQAASRVLSLVEARGAASPNIRVGAERDAEKPFATVGEQLLAVVRAGKGGGVDPRLAHINAAALRMAAAPSGMNESVGSEGGFFIQNDLLPSIMEPVYTDDPLLSRVTRIPIGEGKNGVKYNVVDETSRATGSRWGGIQIYPADEADTATASKPKLRRVEQSLKKQIGAAYLTEELMEDSTAAETLIVKAFQSEARFVIANMIFRGKGAGQMLGFMNSPAFISQAIESGQTIANTPQSIGLNVGKMLTRVPAALWGETIFLYNQELLPYLLNATIGSAGNVPLFVGAGGMTNRPFDNIIGKPAFASELCEAVGTPGDIIAIAPSQYHMAEKGGVQSSTSLHVRFLQDEQVMKITFRVDGQPVTNTAITPFKGAGTRSPFVGLATRS